jgi:hypothetical protein
MLMVSFLAPAKSPTALRQNVEGTTLLRTSSPRAVATICSALRNSLI